MSALDEFAERFGSPQSSWTKEQWKQAAIELASKLDGTSRAPAKQGRPRHNDAAFVIDKNGNVTVSARANYAALAWQVEQRMEQAEADRRSLTMKAAVREELIATIQRHNAARPDQRGKRSGVIGEHRADEILETAYTHVRKLLKEWTKEPDVGSAGAQEDSQDKSIREAIDNYAHPVKEKNPRPDWAKGKPVNLRMRKRH